MRTLLAFGLALTLAACGDPPESGETADVDDAVVSTNFLGLDEAYARAAPAGGTSAVYLRIENSMPEADTLVGVRTDAAGVVEIHRTEDVGEGQTGMVPVVGGVPVPAGETVALEPGGLHVMLLDLQRDLTVGDSLDLEVEFAGRGVLPMRAPVRGLGR